MELWVLGAGAIVLIAITVWIVWWPARAEDGAADGAVSEEPAPAGAVKTEALAVAARSAPAAVPSGQAPAGGVQIRPPVAPANASPAEPWAAPSVPRADAAQRHLPSPRPNPVATPGRGLPLPAMAVILSIVSAVGGAWLYSRWQRGRQRGPRV